MLEIEGPGGSVIRIMAEEDLAHMRAISDEAAQVLVERELDNEAGDVSRRLQDETVRFQAREVLRCAGRDVPAGRHVRDAEEDSGEEVLHLEATESEAAKLIWLHGSGLHSSIRHEHGEDAAQGWVTSLEELDMPWCKFVLPSGPRRPVSFLHNLVRPSWFDIEMDGTMDEEG